MKHAICPSCGGPCIKYGKNKSGTQRWRCNACSMIITPKFDNAAKQLQSTEKGGEFNPDVGDAIAWSEFHRITPYPELWS